MPAKIGPDDSSVLLEFGGGIHSRASEADIGPRECADGQNFILDPRNLEFRSRPPFDLIGTVPNAAEIRGGGTLLKTDGTVQSFIQAGSKVYEWDGGTTFTEIATVSSSAKLRGRLEHQWPLSDKVIVTDIAKAEEVYDWDGSTFASVSFTTDGSTPFTGNFRAKYCIVEGERAWFANVHDNGSEFPHLIVGSALTDYTQIDTSNRPSSSLNSSDPFYMVQPDNRPINGVVEAFGVRVISSDMGSLYQITGSDTTDFAVESLYPRSGASGAESLVYIGNDIAYGRQGRIESVISTDQFGDVETDDLSLPIQDSIETLDDWTAVYNQRLQRVYFFPNGESVCWVFFKSLRDSDVSPWSKFVTDHALQMQPTFVLNMLDPSDGLEYVFMGDGNGNFYRMEGTGQNGDGGTTEIDSFRLSALIQGTLDATVKRLSGWIRYRKGDAITLNLRLVSSGEHIFNKTIAIGLTAAANRKFYNDGNYYSNGVYYGSFSERLARELFKVAGKSNEFQIRLEVTDASPFAISQAGLRFEEGS